jgi:hypothetical protein
MPVLGCAVDLLYGLGSWYRVIPRFFHRGVWEGLLNLSMRKRAALEDETVEYALPCELSQKQFYRE